jgi:hypothetical protein
MSLPRLFKISQHLSGTQTLP